MDGGSPDGRKRAGPFDLLFVLAVGTALTAWSIASAHDAYVGTPDVGDFRRFVEPTSSRYEPKATYLFAPVFEVVGLLGLLASLASSTPILPPRFRARFGFGARRCDAYLLILFFLGCLLGTSLNSARALHAARRFHGGMHDAGAPPLEASITPGGDCVGRGRLAGLGRAAHTARTMCRLAALLLLFAGSAAASEPARTPCHAGLGPAGGVLLIAIADPSGMVRDVRLAPGQDVPRDFVERAVRALLTPSCGRFPAQGRNVVYEVRVRPDP